MGACRVTIQLRRMVQFETLPLSQFLKAADNEVCNSKLKSHPKRRDEQV